MSTYWMIGNDTLFFSQRTLIGTHNHRQSYPSVPSIYHLEPTGQST